jgi:hypothetical protein
MIKNKILALIAIVLLATSLGACGGAAKEPLPKSMKGYELYSWQQKGQWCFTLITGTNRNKTLAEIVTGESVVTQDGWVNLRVVGINEIKDILGRVPAGEWVSWTAGKFVTEPEELSITLEMPPQSIIEEIKAYAEKRGIVFQVY